MSLSITFSPSPMTMSSAFSATLAKNASKALNVSRLGMGKTQHNNFKASFLSSGDNST